VAQAGVRGDARGLEWTMKTTFIRRPGAAGAVMILALLVAAGGTATAAVRSHNGNHLISKHSLSGNRLRNNTVTGKQIKEGSLGQVPKAKNAKTVDGEGVANFRKLVPNGTSSPVTVLSLDGLTLTMTCASSEPDVQGSAAVSGAFMRGTEVGPTSATTGQIGVSNTAPNTPVDLFPASDGRGSMTLHYLRADGTFVDVSAVLDDSPTLDGFDGCLIEGNVIFGG
jgi:hypothetical protein